jgi:hypothetical protein
LAVRRDQPQAQLNDFDHLCVRHAVLDYRQWLAEPLEDRVHTRFARADEELLQYLAWTRGPVHVECIQAARLLREGRDIEALALLDGILMRGPEEKPSTTWPGA